MNQSPRSSVDAIHSPSSPFLQNLQQRLRKGSTASRASSQSSDAVQSTGDISTQPQDGRATKRYLLSILRDDWEYPNPIPENESLNLDRQVSGYRLRDESASEYESSGGRGPRISTEDPYRFEGPDDVGATVRRRRARKRRLLEQEMTWNEGLRIWTLRRDAWTEAVQEKPPTSSQENEYGDTSRKSTSRDGKRSTSSDSAHRSSSSVPSWPLPTPNQNGVDSRGPTDLSQATTNADPEGDLQDGPYLPIYPPLLPASNILRSRIKSTAYPTIYSKVVVQSLSPNVPIPLNHMINALVEGWKVEGNWPPQPLAAERRLANRKPKKAETAFQKWKREQEEKRRAAAEKAQEAQWKLEESEHKGVRKSITGVVKKAFGRKDPDEDSIDRDLEKMGLTFESGGEEEEGTDTVGALANGHV